MKNQLKTDLIYTKYNKYAIVIISNVFKVRFLLIKKSKKIIPSPATHTHPLPKFQLFGTILPGAAY